MDAFRQLGAQVCAISVDSAWAHAAWRAQLQLPDDLLLLSDFNREFGQRYGLTHTTSAGLRDVLRRAVFVIGRDGRIAYRWDNPQPPRLPDPADALAAVRQLSAST